VQWESQVWVNGKFIGKRESLSVPHVYDLTTFVRPGQKNTLLIRVDNGNIYNIGYSHAISEETQTNWNGIIGRIELQAYDPVYLKDIQAYPSVTQKKVKVQRTIVNRTKKNVSGVLNFSGGIEIDTIVQPLLTKEKERIPSQHIFFSGNDSLIIITTNLSLREQVQFWDEFRPIIYSIDIQLETNVGYHDFKHVSFGVREFSTKGTNFLVNGRQTFIRATVNSAEFPLTGYPAMDLKSWIHIFKTCKDYGLNAMRFHSWCPPEAAFEAADRLGLYLQIENSDWRFTVGKDSATNHFLEEEADRILQEYGNHPSFMMFCEGNELVGPTVNVFLSDLVAHWKEKDPRHLYTGSSGYPIIPKNDFHDFYGPRPQRWKEGLKGRFNIASINTLYDYSDYVKTIEMPIISHEIGQWCAFPNFDEIPKFTGILKPYNYELFRELLRTNHLLEEAKEFSLASGKFQVIQKKEEIESFLRTPGLGGYSLLQLQDFPGQGTSPVGVVDIFWDPKPYVTAETFSMFQSDRVPLLRTESFIWTSDQIFKGEVQFANFGPAEMRNVTIHWAFTFPNGKIYDSGNFCQTNIPIGSPISVGKLTVPLKRIEKATKLDLEINIIGTNYRNQWSIWVYPQQLPVVVLKGVMVTYNWDDHVKNYLLKGGKVLLLADPTKIISDVDPVFSGISWNTVWSGMPPDLLGILCDPSHPLFENFPTEYHSNWQWWDIVHYSKPMKLDHMPDCFTPLVQMIPDWNKPHKIGLIFETRVGKGSLLLCSVDLKNRMDPATRCKAILI
jgi:hypothetical protein